jgi:hypothetical protein
MRRNEAAKVLTLPSQEADPGHLAGLIDGDSASPGESPRSHFEDRGQDRGRTLASHYESTALSDTRLHGPSKIHRHCYQALGSEAEGTK